MRLIDRERVAALAEERLDWRFKAVPAAAWGKTVAEYLATRPTLDDLSTPLVTLDAGALDHNLATMARWCAEAGVALAPHGKTTMAPVLWQRQLDAGAVAITLANLPQVNVGLAFGLRRIHLANTLLDPAGLRRIAAESAADPGFRFTSWVDSTRAVELMDEALRGAPAPVDVCVELGAPGARTGCRTLAEAQAVARAVHAAPGLRLTGISGYEGAIAHDATADSLAAVSRYLTRFAELHQLLDSDGLFDQAEEVWITAGGSAYFDTVTELLTPLADDRTRVVLRSGAYFAHDDGFYRGISPLARTAATTPFRSALHGWTRVVSRPEPGLALLDGGKRDLSYDDGLPEPQLVRGRGPLPGGRITALNDQHAFLRPTEAGGVEVSVGETVRLGLSHPCTVFDKWTMLPVLDSADAELPRVVDLVRTFF
ncbi:alanine racemase [Kitasatospora sp. MAP5-34]|uniref:alanine racemase n=1 Tax=Kitasatospora sp. MAP5-34 TaxID=3035102 RepID=UPI00247354DF|nr:alanine racemase [Kitasatospora sp. MAP5-34]MDH6574936.1 D-serine deaminase-like pyridoxal phosphate-dependent protein [Kitasatospora sp. MAP5-34]